MFKAGQEDLDERNILRKYRKNENYGSKSYFRYKAWGGFWFKKFKKS